MFARSPFPSAVRWSGVRCSGAGCPPSVSSVPRRRASRRPPSPSASAVRVACRLSPSAVAVRCPLSVSAPARDVVVGWLGCSDPVLRRAFPRSSARAGGDPPDLGRARPPTPLPRCLGRCSSPGLSFRQRRRGVMRRTPTGATPSGTIPPLHASRRPGRRGHDAPDRTIQVEPRAMYSSKKRMLPFSHRSRGLGRPTGADPDVGHGAAGERPPEVPLTRHRDSVASTVVGGDLEVPRSDELTEQLEAVGEPRVRPVGAEGGEECVELGHGRKSGRTSPPERPDSTGNLTTETPPLSVVRCPLSVAPSARLPGCPCPLSVLRPPSSVLRPPLSDAVRQDRSRRSDRRHGTVSKVPDRIAGRSTCSQSRRRLQSSSSAADQGSAALVCDRLAAARSRHRPIGERRSIGQGRNSHHSTPVGGDAEVDLSGVDGDRATSTRRSA